MRLYQPNRNLFKTLPLPMLFVCAAVSALCVQTCLAQEAATLPISTERPTIGPSSPTLDLVPQGSVQLESGGGISVQRKQFIGDFPESFIRVGLTNRVEFRYLTSNMVYQHSDVPGLDPVQTADTALGTKLLTGKANGLLPISTILSLSIPVGDEGMTSGSYDPSITLAWTQTTPGKFTLIEAAQSTITTRDGERHATMVPSLGIGRPFSDKVTAFVDYAPNVIKDPGMSYVVDGGVSYTRSTKELFDARLGITKDCKGIGAYVADVGMSYSMTTVQQFDLRVGYSNDSSGRHTLSSFGYSVRIDNFLQRLPALNHGFASMGRLRPH